MGKKKKVDGPISYSKLNSKTREECLGLNVKQNKHLTEQLKRLKRLVKTYKYQLLDRKGVQGVGIGFREKKLGKTVGFTNEVVIQIYVEEKIRNLPDWKYLPTELGRSKIPVDIVEVGKIQQTREVAGGQGIKSSHGGLGTLGAIVYDGSTAFGLTNTHVLFEDFEKAKSNDSNATVRLAENNAMIGKSNANEHAVYEDGIDAALIKLNKNVDPNSVINGVAPNGLFFEALPHELDPVLKLGKSGTVKKGVITGVNVVLDIDGETYENQFVVTGSSAGFQPGGDSGAVLVKATHKSSCIGLLHAGSPNGLRGFACTITDVRNALVDFNFFATEEE